MRNIKWIFVLYSLGAMLSMAFIGIAVALRSIPLVIIFIILLFVVMGFGFKTKKKMRDARIIINMRFSKDSYLLDLFILVEYNPLIILHVILV